MALRSGARQPQTAQPGGGAATNARRVGPPPCVGFAATFPRKREKESRLPAL
jgi:hypothetical protein